MSGVIYGDVFKIEQVSRSNPHSDSSDDDINQKYIKGEIRIVTEQARYPLDNIKGMLDSRKYNLSPEYQRRKRWDNERKSRLIESFIMNVPIPPVFLYEVEYSEYEVMDGQQRLNAIYDFYDGKYFLEGLEYWRELEGKKYNELPDQVRRGIDRRYLSSIILLQETAKSKEEADYLKQIVFERLNSGGAQLNAHETRNALYNGRFNEKCIELSKNEKFRKMWEFPLYSEGDNGLLKSDEYRTMLDVELVLRFFAYRHLEQMKGVSVERFLDEYLKAANKYDETTLTQLDDLFCETVNVLYDVFGEKAFVPPQEVRGKTNQIKPAKSIYDPIMQAFSKRLSKKEAIVGNKEVFRKIYDEVRLEMESGGENYLFEGRFNNRGNVDTRIKYYLKFIDENF